MATLLQSDELSQAADLLGSGRLVAFPTETVYGLGANAEDAAAVAKVFHAKGRPSFDPLIVHICDLEMLDRVVIETGATERGIMQRFWPGPLTLVMPKTSHVPDLVTAGLAHVGVRWPAHPVAQELIRLSERPIAAPSANRFGAISPTTAQHVLDQLGDEIDAVIDGGPCQVGVESTVVEVREGTIHVLRLGGVTIEELSEIGSVEIDIAHVDKLAQSSPGRLARHYAPSTPLEIIADWDSVSRAKDIGALAFRSIADFDGFGMTEVLSPTGSLIEAAANFFAALRRLDAAGMRLIFAEIYPDQGLGRALNDRLHRASHR